MVATSGVGNFGVDSPDIRNVFPIQLLPSALDFVQDICRDSRVHPPVPETYSPVL